LIKRGLADRRYERVAWHHFDSVEAGASNARPVASIADKENPRIGFCRCVIRAHTPFFSLSAVLGKQAVQRRPCEAETTSDPLMFN
jgi:hypothetical protein